MWRIPPIEAPASIALTVRFYEPAKTVVDGFKYRNKLDLNVALKALRDCWRKEASMDQLHEAAKVCRVAAVMRPYMETLA